ncbi:MAG: DUF362 domain-containing protein [Atopobiaceae bacterium]|nr:DUF362 domain-containing protein [Atopobiaceae bacterium]MBQ6650638.1 DUF362 domain-containing protein [Atopobiaceae bacterium]
MSASKVYWADLFTHSRTSRTAKLEKVLERGGLGKIDLENKFVAIKMHLGEPGNLSIIRPQYVKVLVDYIKAHGGRPFLTDCNTLYVGPRKDALGHLDAAYENGFNPLTCGCHVIVADGLKGTDDVDVPVEGAVHCPVAKIGRAIMDADVFITLTHFKGHDQTGFGGAIKNIGMGCGSRAGKMEQHAAGRPHIDEDACIGCMACARICAHGAISHRDERPRIASIDQDKCVGCGHCIGVCNQDAIVPNDEAASTILNERMAEYTKAVVDGRPCFHVSLVMDVSPNCDCWDLNDPAIVPDVGIFASLDPVALDQACVDAVNAAPTVPTSTLAQAERDNPDDPHIHDHLHMVSPDTDWPAMLAHSERIGIGNREYELVKVG